MGKKPRSWEKLPARGFNGKEINLPNGTAPDLARHAFNGQDGREQVVCVIQINQSPALGDIANLLEAGVRFYGPLKPDTILARIPLDSVNGLSAISIIQSVAPYGPEYKAIEPGQQEVKYGAYLYLFDGDRPEYRADLDRLGLTIRSYDSSSIMYVVDMDPKRIGWLAEQLWWIRGIAPIFKETAFMLPKTTVNFEANDSRDLIDAYSSGYSGQGVTVGVKDSAIYEQHPDLQGVLHANSDTGGVDKHGTHVTGIIAGRSASLDGPSGFREIKGVAWDASILFRSGIEIGNETISESFNIFINNGIQISNHSYGYTNKFDYDNTSKDIDGYCDNWDMVVVFAAGNEGDRGSETISSSGAPAKNTLTVGAIEYCTDPVGFSIIGRRAAYSGQGPSLDRLKPDIVAPGGMGGVYGVVSTTSDPWLWGKPAVATNWIDGIFDWPFVEWETDDHYIRLNGTSMAAPHVAGVCAQVKQAIPTANSELIKAIVVNSTIPLKDNADDALGGYANTQLGYGMVDAVAAAGSPPDRQRNYYTDWLREDDATRYDDYTIVVPENAKKLVVTMAYNDQEYHTIDLFYSSSLFDDLDLGIRAPGSANFIWATSNKATGVSVESPLEKMVMEDPPPGNWTVRVNLSDSIGFNNPFITAEQRYGLVADVILKNPEISLWTPAEIRVAPKQEFTIGHSVWNSSGYLLAGATTTLGANDADGFGGSVNESRYHRNLNGLNDTVYPQFQVVAPATLGTYEIKVIADAINKGIIPVTNTVPVRVMWFSMGDSYFGLSTDNGATVGWYGASGVGQPSASIVTGAEVKLVATDIKTTPGYASGPACDRVELYYRSYPTGSAPSGAWIMSDMPFLQNETQYPNWEDKFGWTEAATAKYIGPFYPGTRVELFYKGLADGVGYPESKAWAFTNRDDAGGANYRFDVVKAPAAVYLPNLAQTYNGAARTVTATTMPAGLTVSITYNGSATVPINAGSYAVTGTVNSTQYHGSTNGTLVVAKASQTITFLAIGNKVTTDMVGLSATASSGLPVSFTVGSGPGSITGGTNLSFTGTGVVSVVASQAGNMNWNPAPNVTQAFNVSKAPAAVFLQSLAQTYNGTARTLTATTMPAGLTVAITYNGAAGAPTNAGSYAVTGTVNSTQYQGLTNGTLVVERATDTIMFGATNQIYNGTARIVLATAGSGSSVALSYNGLAAAPTNAGNYAVTGIVNALNWRGTNTTALAVAKASQTITFPAIGDKVATDIVGLSATATSDLTVTFAVGNGPGSITSGTNLSFAGTGVVSVVGSQVGNMNWNPAPSLTNTFSVSKAPAVVYLQNLAQTYDGAARTVTATTMPAGLTVLITYDGLATAPSNVGIYAVTGTVSDAIYDGLAAGMLEISTALTPFEVWVETQGHSHGNPDFAVMADYDRDGMTTWQEYLADTDPADSNILLTIQGFYDTTDHQIRLAFPASTSRYYQMECCTDLTNYDISVSNLGWGVPGMVITNAQHSTGAWYWVIRALLNDPTNP